MIREIKIQSGSNATRHAVDVSLENGATAGKARIVMDGAAEEVDWAEVEPGVYSLIAGGKSFTVSARKEPAASTQAGKGGRYQVSVGGRSFQIETQDSGARRRAPPGRTHDGPAEILAPMPGRIAKLLAQENAVVTQGAGLLVIEAMKMQNEIRAPRAGKVGEVCVREGESVEMGARLMRID